MTGSRRRISSAGGTTLAAMLLAAAPNSTISAPPATSWRAWAIAAAGSRYRPPSENESSVMLRMPISSGPAIGSHRAGPFEDRADPLGIGVDVDLLDRHPRMRDPRVGEAGGRDPLGEPLAQVDMTGAGDLADRRHDLFVIDDAAPVFMRIGGVRRRGQLDRDAHALQPVAFDPANPDAAQQHEIAHDDGIAVRCGNRAFSHRNSTRP